MKNEEEIRRVLNNWRVIALGVPCRQCSDIHSRIEVLEWVLGDE